MSTTKATFREIYTSLDWANTQIGFLSKEMATFFEGKPYEIVSKPYTDGAGYLFYARLATPIPDALKPVVAGILNTQRSSLDLLATALAKQNGAATNRHTYFPIAGSREAFLDKSTTKKVRALHPADRKALSSLKPYKGGNDILYALNWLNNKSKHRELHALATVPMLQRIGGSGSISGVEVFRGDLSTDRHTLVMRTQADPDIEFDLSMDITFKEIAGEKPVVGVVPILHKFCEVCRAIVAGFDRPIIERWHTHQ